jgi:hypothetical protein
MSDQQAGRPVCLQDLRASVDELRAALSVWTPAHRREAVGAKLAVQGASDIERAEMLIESMEAYPRQIAAIVETIRANAQAEGLADDPRVTKTIEALLEFRDDYCRAIGIAPPAPPG